MTDPNPVVPLDIRRAMLDEPGIGAGAFLQYALQHNPNPDVPFLYGHELDEQGEVILIGHSLRDLAAIRDRYARWYHAAGVCRGDTVGLYLDDSLEPFLHFLALTALGALPALINGAMPPETMRAYVEHVGVAALVAHRADAAAAAFQGASSIPLLLISVDDLRDAAPAAGDLPAGYPHAPGADDTVALIHSSGTTGMPKATAVGHLQYWIGRANRVLRFPSGPQDKLLTAMPQTHAAGISYLLNSTLIGLPTVAMSSWRRSVVEPVMLAFQPTMMVAFPRSYVELATGPAPREAAAHMHTWISTGDRAHHAHIRKLIELGTRPDGRPGSQFIDGLGSSELGMSLFERVSTPESGRDDCCMGRPIDIVREAVVLGPSGETLPDGAAGLLGVRTPTRTPGYWNAPELTEEHTLNGYWLSGDVVRRTADGRFYHLDRSADVIAATDGPVYSLPMEEVLLADCAALIVDCTVVGVADATGSAERPVAVVVMQPGAAEPAPDALLTTLNAALAAARQPALAAAAIAREDTDFPLGATGKVLKRQLRTRLSAVMHQPA